MKRGMYCKRCWYDLRGLASTQCPECGAGFNPEVASSFLLYPGKRMPAEALAVLGMQFVAILIASISYALLRSSGVLFGDDMDGGYFCAFCLALLIQAGAVFYGICVSIFQYRSVARSWRKCFLMVTLAPFVISLLLICLA